MNGKHNIYQTCSPFQFVIQMKKFTLFLFLISIVLVSGCADSSDSMEEVVKEGDYITVDYIGELENGNIFDTSIQDAAIKGGIYNRNREYKPLGFTVGADQMIKGFDSGVVGMAVGEEKTLVLPPEEAYEYREELVVTANLDDFTSVDIFPVVGNKINTPWGAANVIEVTDTEVKLDFNSDQTGKTLIFKVTLVSIGQE